MPVLSIDGGSVSVDSSVAVVRSFHSTRSEQCQSSTMVCSSSISNTDSCSDINPCDFLPPRATLQQALLTLEIACSDFGSANKSVEDVRICPLPDCSVYGQEYTWSKESVACCWCNLGTCSCFDFTCSNSLSSFSAGPWIECSNRCDESRPVLFKYDVTDIMCKDVETCTSPALYYQIVLTSFVDGTCGSNLIVAQLTLDVQYYFEWTYGAGTELPTFTHVDVKESTKVAGSLNSLSLRLRTNAGIVFLAGGIISVTGLQNSSKEAGLITVISLDCNEDFSNCQVSNFQPFPTLAAYDPVLGSVLIGPAINTITTPVFYLQFTLHNPPIPQPAVQLGVSATSEDGLWSIDQALTNQLVFSADDSPLCSGNGLQLYDNDNRENSFFLQIFCNYPVESDDSIQLTGLASMASDSPTVPIMSEDNGIIDTGLWNHVLDSLTVNIARTYSANEPIYFSFKLKNENRNPVFLNPITSIHVTFIPSSSIWSDVFVYPDFYLQIQNDLSAARVAAVIAEENQRKSEPNALTCSMLVGINLFSGDQVIIHGLLGSGQAASNSLPLNSSHGQIMGIWDNVTGSLSFFLVADIPAANPFTFRFELLNPSEAKTPNQIYISIATVRGDLLPMRQCIGNVLSLTTKAVSFVVIQISENSNVQHDLNQITVGFSMNTVIAASSTLEISGLNGTQTPKGPIEVESSRNYFNTTGYWDGSRLKVDTIIEIAAGENIQLNFNVINAGSPGPKTRLVSIAFSGISAKGSELEAQILGAGQPPAFVYANASESNGVPGAPNTVRFDATANVYIDAGSTFSIFGLTGTSTISGPLAFDGLGAKNISTSYFDASQGVLKFTLNKPVQQFELISVQFTLINSLSVQKLCFPGITASALGVDGKSFDIRSFNSSNGILGSRVIPYFLNTSAMESSVKLGQENTVEIAFQTNFLIFMGLNITLSSLAGTQSRDNSDLKLHSNVKLVQVSWQNIGSLVMRANQDVAPFQQIFVKFTVINSPYPRNPVTPCISSDVTPEELAIVPVEQVWYDGIRLWSGDQSPSESKGVILGPYDDTIWNEALIGESTVVSGQPNTLSVTLIPSISLEAHASLTLSGLTGSLTQGTSLQLTGFSSVKFGQWIGELGSLSFTLDRQVNASAALTFQFTLINPNFKQPAVLPSVSAASATGSAYGSWPLQLSSTTLPACCLSAVEIPKFLRCTVRETLNVPNQPNLLNFTFLSNTYLPPGTLLTIMGLDGLQTPTNPTIPLSQNVDTTGNWTQETGTLIVSINAAFYTCQESCGQLIEFSACFKNPPSAAVSNPTLVASASFAESYSIRIGSTPIYGNILKAEGTPIVLSEVRESSNVSGAVNTISMAVRPNVVLSACLTTWLVGSASWADDTSGAELSCPWRNGNKCLPVTNLFDGLLGSGIEISLTGTRTVSFNLLELYGVDGFKVFVDRGASNAKTLRFQYIPMSNTSSNNWQDAGVMNVLQGGLMTVLNFNESIPSQRWRFILEATADVTGEYPFSSIQELQVKLKIESD